MSRLSTFLALAAATIAGTSAPSVDDGYGVVRPPYSGRSRRAGRAPLRARDGSPHRHLRERRSVARQAEREARNKARLAAHRARFGA